jgi:CBS domain-containing protein
MSGRFAFHGASLAGVLQKAKIKDILETLRIPALVHVQKEERVFSVIEPLRQSGIGAVMVDDGHAPVGIFTDGDLLDLCLRNVDLRTAVLGNEMSPLVVTGSAEMSIIDGIHLLNDNNVKHLPISKFVGDAIDDDARVSHILTSNDFLSFLLKVSGSGVNEKN